MGRDCLVRRGRVVRCMAGVGKWRHVCEAASALQDSTVVLLC
jgi:hypothetical protein